MKGALDSIKLQMLRTEIVRNVRNREILGGTSSKPRNAIITLHLGGLQGGHIIYYP